MNDTLNITIRIANNKPIPLAIRRDDEEVIRTAEYNVNRLWQSWSQRYKGKSQTEVLAMVAFRFAELFYRGSAIAEQTEKSLAGFEADIDRILMGMSEAEK